MLSFKLFLESEEEKNVKELISKLPKSHQKLLKGFKVIFTPKNTLKGDKDHIGYIHKDKIVVAAPWKYSRSMVFLHEIAHLLWEKLLIPELKKEWSKLVKKNPLNNQDNDEEAFSMAYACHYSEDHCPKLHDHPEWHKFIEKISNL